MPDYAKYIPRNKVFVAFSAEQLNEKTDKFVDKLIADGVDPDMIHISQPAIAQVDKGYIICHSVKWYLRDKNTDDYEE